ncbi:MAG: XdhC/CoxI family protein [Chloroflexota bacterium]
MLNEIQQWQSQGKRIALATVVRTWGSAPRPVGSKMAVSEAAEMVGSVSGGCVEGVVVEHAQRVLRSGRPELLHFGVSDEAAWEVGLACGGQIEILVESLEPLRRARGEGASLLESLLDSVQAQRPVVRAVVTRGPEALVGASIVVGGDGRSAGMVDPRWGDHLRSHALDVLGSGVCDVRRLRLGETEVEVFFDVLLGPPTLAIVGGVHIAIELTRLAKVLGYRVIIIDPRRAFATSERFPLADQLVPLWPDEGLQQVGMTEATAVVVLSHDPKLDDPALQVALRSPAFYVGALGSKKTQALRREGLLQAGFSEGELARLRGPIGLNISARSPEEIALSILAEIVAARGAKRPMESLSSSTPTLPDDG